MNTQRIDGRTQRKRIERQLADHGIVERMTPFQIPASVIAETNPCKSPLRTQPVVLPPSHPFAQLSEEGFEAIFGPHAYLVIQLPLSRA